MKFYHKIGSEKYCNERTWTTTKQKLYDQIINILINNSYVLIYDAKDLTEEEYIKIWAKSVAKKILDEILKK